jgi:hypothetical protein
MFSLIFYEYWYVIWIIVFPVPPISVWAGNVAIPNHVPMTLGILV